MSARPPRPVGSRTRGKTAPNRLRRVDRWMVATCRRRLSAAADPLVVDLGYGAAHWTTTELAARLARVRPDVQVVGLELDPARVAAAAPYADPPRTSFRCGGFELPLGGRSPVLVRAFNVLRQYDESEVPAAWARLTSALAPGGMVIEGTCGKIGRRACWVALDRSGPHTLTLAAHLPSLACPSELAPRLPKCLIHHNVPGEPVHELLVALDRAWARAAPLAVFGPRCRWVETVAAVAAAGWPVRGRRARWRAGEITVDWAAVAPSCSAPGRRGRAGASRAAG